MTETLVASGSFGVDRARALDVLKRWELPDARDFLIPWLSLAAVSGASTVDVRSRWRGLAVSFDGRPIPRARLADPYECLFGDAQRSHELVAGLLGALRLEPAELTIRSGDAAGVVSLSIDAWGRQTLGAELGREPGGTAIDIRWRGWFTRGLTRECMNRARLAGRPSAIPVFFDGEA